MSSASGPVCRPRLQAPLPAPYHPAAQSGCGHGRGAGGAEGTHTQGGEEAREVAGEGGRGDYLREGVRRKMEGRRGGGGEGGEVLLCVQ